MNGNLILIETGGKSMADHPLAAHVGIVVTYDEEPHVGERFDCLSRDEIREPISTSTVQRMRSEPDGYSFNTRNSTYRLVEWPDKPSGPENVTIRDNGKASR